MTDRKQRWQRSRPSRRRRPHRPGNPRVLILCEGAKTETDYFSALKTAERLTSVVVRPSRLGQAGPRGLWERARDELRDDPGWDEIHCVLDHDGRDSAIDDLEQKLAALDRWRHSTRVAMTLSDPCFEYWLLLHFEFTDRPFTATGQSRSACDEVIEQLRRHLPDYRKNDPRVFAKFRGRMDDAICNAARAESKTSSGLPPRTDIGKLVARLLDIADRRRPEIGV